MSVEYVERAATWSRELTRMRARGPGDTENAMRAIERDYAIDFWVIWRLRYRVGQIKDIGVSTYARIEAAHRAECERQRRLLGQQVENARRIGLDSPLVDAAAAMARDSHAEETDTPGMEDEP
jgi:hypothetical protein